MIGSADVWAERPLGRSLAWRSMAGLTLVGCVVAVLALAIALLPLTWAVLLVFGGIVLVATLVWPQLGVLLVVPAVPFGSLYQVNLGMLNVGVTE